MSEETEGPLSSVNPTKLLSLINKYASVELIKNYSYTGFVHSIDPISGSIILLTPTDGGNKKYILMGHAVRTLKLIDSNDLSPPKTKEVIPLTKEELLKRKCSLIHTLQRNLLPFQETDGVINVGNVSFHPPYGLNNIHADNIVVYTNMRNMLVKSFVETVQ